MDILEGLVGVAEDDMERATWFCIDIECSGPVPGLYDMISLGAVAVHENGDGSLSIGASFYQELKPQGPRVDPGAMEVNGLDLARLKREGLERRVALEELSAWVGSQVSPGAKAVFVGHNAPFDWSFVSWCFAAEEMPNPFGYKALDTKALATGVLGVHWLDSSKEVLSKVLNLPAEDLTLKHRADYDAAYQAQILVALLERSRGVAGEPGAT